jgi:hypothetical protein
MALTWLLFVGITVGWIAFLIWRHQDSQPPTQTEPPFVTAIVSIVAGGFFFAIGVASYAILLFTDCFTFNFKAPVWSGFKARLYLANIVVMTAFALGMGFGITILAGPLLMAFGMSGQMAFFVPVMVMVVVLQIVRVFVLIWAPVETRLITKRLQARGLTPAQLQTALPVGISNPLRSSFKKMSRVEEDIGALWVGPEQIVYYGDSGDFAVTREQLMQIERKADSGGTSMLGGITHLILHVRQADGSERQIRFHMEGQWTMGGKGRAMDELEERIVQWHAGSVPQALA